MEDGNKNTDVWCFCNKMNEKFVDLRDNVEVFDEKDVEQMLNNVIGDIKNFRDSKISKKV